MRGGREKTEKKGREDEREERERREVGRMVEGPEAKAEKFNSQQLGWRSIYQII